MLSHYSHVVWYTGDDYVPRAPDAPGGSGIDKLAVDTQNRVRDFINEGGKLFFTGQNAGRVFAEDYDLQPVPGRGGRVLQTRATECIAVQDDFLQYWLGRQHLHRRRRRRTRTATALPISGFKNPPFDGRPVLALGGLAHGVPAGDELDLRPGDLPAVGRLGEGAGLGSGPAPRPSTRRATGSCRPAPTTPPTSGSRSVRPDRHDRRDALVLDVLRPRGRLRLHVRRDPHGRPGRLDDAEEKNGLTADDTGLSCPSTGDGSNWQSLHPFLAHYQTKIDDGYDCDPTGTSRRVVGRHGQLGRLEAVGARRPGRVPGQGGRDVDHGRDRPGHQGLGEWIDDALRRQLGRAVQHLVRDRRRRLDEARPAGRHARTR